MPFSFEGGIELNRMGAVWFVSYCYYEIVDSNHLNWKKVDTYPSRRSRYNRTRKYHKGWLLEVLRMNEDKLNTNTLGLTGLDVIEMASKILRVLY